MDSVDTEHPAFTLTVATKTAQCLMFMHDREKIRHTGKHMHMLSSACWQAHVILCMLASTCYPLHTGKHMLSSAYCVLCTVCSICYPLHTGKHMLSSLHTGKHMLSSAYWQAHVILCILCTVQYMLSSAYWQTHVILSAYWQAHVILCILTSRVGRFWVLRKVKLCVVTLGAKWIKKIKKILLSKNQGELPI